MKQSPNSTTTLALNIDRLMRRIHAELQPRASEFDQYRVGPLGGMLLLTLGEREPADIQSVVEALGRDKSQISRLIQRYERQGLLVRQKSAQDGRVSLLRLTPAGRQQLEWIQEALAEVVGDIFAGLSREERAAFSELLARVLAGRGDSPED
ncbi:MAG: MarR family transcriptional regulator [Pseudomonadota bacterium]